MHYGDTVSKATYHHVSGVFDLPSQWLRCLTYYLLFVDGRWFLKQYRQGVRLHVLPHTLRLRSSSWKDCNHQNVANKEPHRISRFHRWKRYEFGFCPIPEHCGLAAFPAHRAPLCAACLNPAQLRGSRQWFQRISLTKLQQPHLENAIVSQFHIHGSRIVFLNWMSRGPSENKFIPMVLVKVKVQTDHIDMLPRSRLKMVLSWKMWSSLSFSFTKSWKSTPTTWTNWMVLLASSFKISYLQLSTLAGCKRLRRSLEPKRKRKETEAVLHCSSLLKWRSVT